jgi:hypothetical protein
MRHSETPDLDPKRFGNAGIKLVRKESCVLVRIWNFMASGWIEIPGRIHDCKTIMRLFTISTVKIQGGNF